MSDTTHTFWAAELSLFSGKVRAYLRYKGIPFEEQLADLKVVNEVLYPRVKRKMIPVVVTPDDEYLLDSTHIMDVLELRFPEAPVVPQSPRQRLAAALFEHFGDEWLLIPAMHYRWEYDKPFVIREMSNMLVPGKPLWRQLPVSAPIMAYFGIGARRAVGVSKATKGAIEDWYEEFLGHFNAHLEQHPFLLGTRPSVGDFGLMGPLYAHLGRDPTSRALMERLAPRVADWVDRMNAPEPRSGDFLPDDEVPETLFPIMKRLFREQFPVLHDTVKRTAAWIEANPGRRMPRVLGKHEFRIGDATGTRAVLPYNQWMLQRTVDHYRSLQGEKKQAVEGLLDRVGGRQPMQVRIARRVTRVDNRTAPE